MHGLYREPVGKSGRPSLVKKSEVVLEAQNLLLARNKWWWCRCRKPSLLETSGGGGTICEPSSGMEPDLGVFGNPWIDAMKEWSNHAIASQASAEVVTRSLDNPREGDDDPALRECESCDVRVIGVVKGLEGPEMDSAVYEEYQSVPRFEGEEENQCETTDLPVAECHPSRIEFLIVEVFDRAPKSMWERIGKVPQMFLNPAVGSAKFLEGLETRYDASTTLILRLEPLLAVGTYEEGQGDVKNAYRNKELTLGDTVNPRHSPGVCFEALRIVVVVDCGSDLLCDIGGYSKGQ